jgi:hypothetical protein
MKRVHVHISSTVIVLLLLVFAAARLGAVNLTPSVTNDPLVRMPGTQPGQVSLEAPGRCLNCHAGYQPAIEPGHNWKGSMMAQSARDFLFWPAMAVAGQDSAWALDGSPNAMDLCLRCHMPKGWLEGRSDPPNATAMKGADFDGVQCDFCHRMWDPFFESTFAGSREGADWLNYWDETNASGTPSQPAANSTYNEDAGQALNIFLFNGGSFFSPDKQPFSATYTESAGGQYFVSTGSDKRASFADATARHRMLYSRYHKSKYFCATCHDVSNPVLANLGAEAGQPLPTEENPAFSYYHVERTFSEFMLSDYGQQGGAAGIGPFAPQLFTTSLPNNYIARCQDCHMRDGVGRGSNKNDSPIRPTESVEHPNSGQPIHDLTGGNTWVPYVLASTATGSPNYDPVNASLLNQGAAVLTLDLNQGLGLDPVALLDAADRARQQLELAATIQNVTYNAANGQLSFRIQNQTGHKLISGYPEGRRIFINVRAYAGGELIYEVNPYDTTAGTLKNLNYNYQPGYGLPLPQPLAAHETYRDELVYEMKTSSLDLTGETTTFHFVLATDRYKDNRIPPQGFRIHEAAGRMAQPRWQGADAYGYFTAAEYAGGYDDVSLAITAGADYVEIKLFYQITSREYIEFLRDEINGTGNLTLPPDAYTIQTDPFFARLKAWGNTIWQLWTHNMNVPGAAPVLMTEAVWGMPPPPACTVPGTPQNVAATAANRNITINWSAGSPPPISGYNLYYDQAGKLQHLATTDALTLSYTDRNLKRRTEYCYVITAWNDCNGNGLFDPGNDAESGTSLRACATTK